MHFLLLFGLGLWFCRRLMHVHAVIALFQALLLPHKPGRIFSKLLAYSRVFRKKGFERFMVLQVVPVIGKRRIAVQVFVDLLVLVKITVHVLKFFLA